MSGKGNVKVDAILYFDGFVPNDSPVALSLAGTDTELAICDKFDAVITITPTKFYEMMKAKKEENMVPVFRVEVVDPDTKKPTPFDRKDDTQKELNLEPNEASDKAKAELDAMMKQSPDGEPPNTEETEEAAPDGGQPPETDAGTDLTTPKHVC